MGFECAADPDVEQVVGQKQQKQDGGDGVYVVVVDVVGVPLVDQFVEALVFYVPPPVADSHYGMGVDFLFREAGGPEPFGNGGLLFFVSLAADRGGFQALHYAHGVAQLWPRQKSFDVMATALFAVVVKDDWLFIVEFEQAAKVFNQFAVFVFKYRNEVFVVLQNEFA